MTSTKALEILRLDKNCAFEGDSKDLEQAHQLGIESLERILEMREYNTLIGMASSNPGRLLPSETEDYGARN